MFTRKTVSIGSVVALALLLHPTPAHAGDRQRVMAISSPSTSLAITFNDAEAGVVDAGTMQWCGGSKRSVVTTRRVIIRIGRPSRELLGTASLRAFLEVSDPRATIRIDGVTLTNSPRLIQTDAPIGSPVSHRIEIEIPVSAPEGPLLASIGWEVTTN